MGVVYEAVDSKRQQRIAIKAAKPGFHRFLSPELEGALHVRHHNICLVNEIHSVRTSSGETDFLTMELLQGETLSAHIAAQGKLASEEALDIARQLCAGIAEAHRSGILHGDLKTNNVMLCEEPNGSCRVVITDFGLASLLALPSGETGGTPAYMAPELWKGEKASKASDIYALGVIFYEMVTGVLPYVDQSDEPATTQNVSFEGPTISLHDQPTLQSWQHRTRTTLPPAPSSRTRNLDARWERIIMACLALSTENRPQDIGEILTVLRLLSGFS